MIYELVERGHTENDEGGGEKGGRERGEGVVETVQIWRGRGKEGVGGWYEFSKDKTLDQDRER